MSTPPDPQSVADPQPPGPGPGSVAVQARPRTKVRRPAVSAPAHKSLLEEEREGFFQRFGIVLVIGGLLAAGGAYAYFKKPGPPSAPLKPERIVMIAPLPPAPPPPPPPPPPLKKPPEEKMDKETAPVEAPKPVEKPQPAKAPDDPAPLGTNLKGDGAGLSGLGTGPGLGGGTLGGGGSKGGSRFGWYAGQVQARIADALRKHPKTKNANLRVDVRIWPDPTGRITRAQLAGSTGDGALDDALQREVLNGLQLQEPPPAGMKLPITLRLTARRPN
jgi:outer membrane biosynthesis protein TonB